MRKRMIGILPTLFLCLGVLHGAIFAADAGTNTAEHSHSICGVECRDSNRHKDIVWTGVSSLDEIKTAGNYYLVNDVEPIATWKPVDGVKLCLNGKTIRCKAWGAAIQVNPDVTFTLTDCTDKGSIIHGTGRERTNGKSFAYSGSGICVDGGRFVMEGGIITGNGNGRYSYLSEYSPYEIYNVDGGGVKVNSGSFIMNGGKINGNVIGDCFQQSTYADTRPDIDCRHGGGVYLGSSASFTMNDGEIKENSVKGYQESKGGGVYISDGAVFTMNGGSITGNKTYGSNSSNMGNAFGSAVYIAENDISTAGGSFIMNGGAITNNQAITGIGGNGAIYCEPGGSLLLDGKINISGNTHVREAGTVLPSQLEKAPLSSNIYLNSKSYGNDNAVHAEFKTGKSLNPTSKIGVRISAWCCPTMDSPLTLSSAFSENYADYFQSDDQNFTLGEVNGVLKVWCRDRTVTIQSNNTLWSSIETVSKSLLQLSYGSDIYVNAYCAVLP